MARDILDTGSWCILRMASADTLKIAQSLGASGLEVWTPTEKRFCRLPRRKARVDRESALMPSYAFGHVRHVGELLHLAMIPRREHPKFSVFRYQGGIPLVADDELAPLRTEQDRVARVFDKWKRRGMKGPVLAKGAAVRLPDGPFAGISGIVEGTEGQFTLVDITVFGKPSIIKVASILLLPETHKVMSRAA